MPKLQICNFVRNKFPTSVIHMQIFNMSETSLIGLKIISGKLRGDINSRCATSPGAKTGPPPSPPQKKKKKKKKNSPHIHVCLTQILIIKDILNQKLYDVSLASLGKLKYSIIQRRVFFASESLRNKKFIRGRVNK